MEETLSSQAQRSEEAGRRVLNVPEFTEDFGWQTKLDAAAAAAAVVSSGCNECANQGFSSRGRERWPENCNFLRRRCDLINVSLKGDVTVDTRRLQMRGEGNSVEWSTVRQRLWVVLVIWDRWLSSVCFVPGGSWLASRFLIQRGSWSEWRKNLSLVWPGDGGEGRREDDTLKELDDEWEVCSKRVVIILKQGCKEEEWNESWEAGEAAVRGRQRPL